MWTDKRFRPFVTLTGYAACLVAGFYLATYLLQFSAIVFGATKLGTSTQQLLQFGIPGFTMLILGMQQIIIARIVFVGIPQERRSEDELVLGSKEPTDA